MAVQLSILVRNARLDQIESIVSPGSPQDAAILEIRTGAQPANCAAADSGTVLVSMPLPGDWLLAASGGTKAKNGTWSVVAIGAGVAAHFRIKQAWGSPNDCHIQGTVGQGSGDMSLDNTTIAVGQTVTVNTFTLTDGNP